jgi:hypothetical protein
VVTPSGRRRSSRLHRIDLPADHAAGEQQAVEGAIAAVNSGPLGANAVPGASPLPDGSTAPFNPLKDTAFHALGSAYPLGYLIVGLCALAAALVTVALVRGNGTDTLVTAESPGRLKVGRSGRRPRTSPP